MPANNRLMTDFHLAQGIPALSPPTGKTDLRSHDIQSFDMNTAESMANIWLRTDGGLGGRFLHSDIKNADSSPLSRKIRDKGEPSTALASVVRFGIIR